MRFGELKQRDPDWGDDVGVYEAMHKSWADGGQLPIRSHETMAHMFKQTPCEHGLKSNRSGCFSRKSMLDYLIADAACRFEAIESAVGGVSGEPEITVGACDHVPDAAELVFQQYFL